MQLCRRSRTGWHDDRHERQGIGMTSRARVTGSCSGCVDREFDRRRCWSRFATCRATCLSTKRWPVAPTKTRRLPIGLGQTISQPYVVARMTEALLDGFEGETVLEIGTGCGYQTAVLAPLVKKIYTVERIPELLRKTGSDCGSWIFTMCSFARRRLGGLAKVRPV